MRSSWSSQPEWVTALKVELREVHRELAEIRENHTLIANALKRAEVRQLTFEADLKHHVDDRLSAFERAISHFLLEHQSSVGRA
jgi:hypothetical protein